MAIYWVSNGAEILVEERAPEAESFLSILIHKRGQKWRILMDKSPPNLKFLLGTATTFGQWMRGRLVCSYLDMPVQYSSLCLRWAYTFTCVLFDRFATSEHSEEKTLQTLLVAFYVLLWTTVLQSTWILLVEVASSGLKTWHCYAWLLVSVTVFSALAFLFELSNGQNYSPFSLHPLKHLLQLIQFQAQCKCKLPFFHWRYTILWSLLCVISSPANQQALFMHWS